MRTVTSAEVIVNASSGTGASDDLRQRLTEAFDPSDLKLNIVLAQSGAEIVERARVAATGTSRLIIAGGGDGTINSVATEILGRNKTLGVLPLGTLNHFAKDLNLPLDLETAAKTIVAGHSIEVDVGEANGHFFLNNSSLGLYPQIVRRRQRHQRLGYGKWPAFAWAALSTLRRYPFLDVHLEVEGEKLYRRTPFVFIGNNEYVMESLDIGIRKRLNAGKLSLYMTNGTGRLGLVRLALHALMGRVDQEQDFLALSSEQMRIATTRRSLLVAFDGEVKELEAPLHYRILPRALRVIVPADR